jgi:hypothetical protein
MKKLTHVVVTLTFAFACLSLWALLTALGKVSAHTSQALPAFTALVIGLRTGLLLLPIQVAGYCLYTVFRRQPTEPSGTAFLAWTMSALGLVFFPVFIAMFLPCHRLIEQVK